MLIIQLPQSEMDIRVAQPLRTLNSVIETFERLIIVLRTEMNIPDCHVDPRCSIPLMMIFRQQAKSGDIFLPPSIEITSLDKIITLLAQSRDFRINRIRKCFHHGSSHQIRYPL
uniref:Uncharacterized protein n=1 Tax=Ralstonia solanacearum TaxID=305 RepID=A0A0S4W823_RALSL|nr:protein of unknown function [Ralstonia solanacearum]CUV37502.1 protein of unknown function [Ralstonia solanacearum]CUV42655.1 protein of unknown function [Ralstonia solanacearum]CUV62425.1 protein of unknown function [Ralstonia solanacearum]